MTEHEDRVAAAKAAATRFLNGHGRPTAREHLTWLGHDVAVDVYGDGGVVAQLEERVAVLLGKDAAIFMPSGTMAQQIALRIHTEDHGTPAVAMHPLSHLILHEEQGPAILHGLRILPVGNRATPLTLADLESIAEPLAAVLWELPQRELGGTLPTFEELESQTALVREAGTATHLDGARLWESQPALGVGLPDIAELFDSIYVSLYKGLGGISGCILAGDEDFISRAAVWRRRHGGTIFGLWPLAASGLAGLERHLPAMGEYVARCAEIVAALTEIDGVRATPDPPPTNMCHLLLDAPKDVVDLRALEVLEERGWYTWGWTAPGPTTDTCFLELTVGSATEGWQTQEIVDVLRGFVAP